MTLNHAMRAVRALRIHCPIDSDTVARIAAGDLADIDPGSALGTMLAIIRRDGPLGDFGLYTSVVELGLGWEMFTPAAGAQPTLGAAGQTEVSATAILTVYIPANADEDAVTRAIDAIMAAHPWEVPVIEWSETRLLTRA